MPFGDHESIPKKEEKATRGCEAVTRPDAPVREARWHGEPAAGCGFRNP